MIWDTESWVANTDDRFAGVVAANRAAGYDRSMGTLSRVAISTLSHNRVATDMIQTPEGRRRVDRHIEARPLAAAYGAVQHLIGEREFREILFTNGLPWVFAFHGLGGNPDDGTVVVVGDLGTLFEKGTPLFSGVRSLAEVRAKEPLRRQFQELPLGRPATHGGAAAMERTPAAPRGPAGHRGGRPAVPPVRRLRQRGPDGSDGRESYVPAGRERALPAGRPAGQGQLRATAGGDSHGSGRGPGAAGDHRLRFHRPARAQPQTAPASDQPAQPARCAAGWP